MKIHSRLTRLFCLLLAALTLFCMTACPAGEPAPGTSGEGSTTGNGQPSNPSNPTDAVYGQGGEVEGAGALLAEGCYALTPHTPDEANAVEVATLAALFRQSTPDPGVTYRLTGDTPATLAASGREYDGQGAFIIAPMGVVIDGATDFTLKNLVIVGEVSFVGASDCRFEEVEIYAPNGTALTLSQNSQNITLHNCRLTGKTAVKTEANGTVLQNSALYASECGIYDAAAEGTVAENCLLTCEKEGILSKSAYAQFLRNTVSLPAEGVGLTLQGAKHTLVALNIFSGAQRSANIENVLNTSVILNSAVTLAATGSESLYLCENALGGRLRLENNNYLLADGNLFSDDGLDHSAWQKDNKNTNGSDITDESARADVGVNENLLPHVNKDLFLDMERKETVKVGATDTGLALNSYIMQQAKGADKRIILAPGAYTVTDRTDLRGNAGCSGTVIYGYGVMMERAENASTQSGGACGNQFNIIEMQGFTLKGMTLSYARQSVGQAYVLEKRPGNKLLIVAGAGFVNEFGNSDRKLYNTTWMGPQRAGDFYPYCDASFNSVTHTADGLMEMSVSDAVYEMTRVGDVLTCENSGSPTLYTAYSTDVMWKDVTLYGAAGVFGSMENYNRTSTTYYRVAITTKSAPVIDEETYNRYLALGETYGVDFEITVDALGRFRGSLPRIGADDATHTTACAQGSVAVSCIFENMSDDATNQNHQHARVHGITDNGDGTSTVIYKGNYTQIGYDRHSYGRGSYCHDFIVGDRVFMYTAYGRLVADTEALSVTVKHMEGGAHKKVLNSQMYNRAKTTQAGVTEADCMTLLYEVTVKTADINSDALVGYDLTNNDWNPTHKVLIDNMSMASNGFLFDNVLVQNVRSRALLIKASDGKITNCTFRNIGMSCAAVLYELEWGESGISENLVIEKNEMDNTGFFRDVDYYSPISINGLGSRVEEDYLLYKNIVIRDNVMTNRRTEYGLYLRSACGVEVTGNDFGSRAGGDTEDLYSRAILIYGAMNVKIEGNTYSPLGLPIEDCIKASENKNIYGADVGDFIPDSN